MISEVITGSRRRTEPSPRLPYANRRHRASARCPASCDTMITPERNRVVDAAPGLIEPRFRPYWIRLLLQAGFGFGLGARVGDATCLPSAVPGLRASTLKRTVFISARAWSRPRLLGTSLGCLPSLWVGPCLRPAPSPLSSPKIPDLLPAVDRRRWDTIERHHS